MSTPTEMELRRPEPEITPAWDCKVAGCKEPVPADVEDQPHCESCHVPVCEVHVVTRCHVHLCCECYLKEREVMMRISHEMYGHAVRLRKSYSLIGFYGDEAKINNDFDPNDVQFACERWMKEIGDVL